MLFDKDGHVAHPWIAAAVCMLGTFGLGLLWFLDLNVYYRLLNAVFYEGVRLEAKYPWLPQIRAKMKDYAGNVRAKLAWYYFFTTMGPLLAGVSLFAYYQFYCSAWAAGILGGTSCLVLLIKTRSIAKTSIPGP